MGELGSSTDPEAIPGAKLLRLGELGNYGTEGNKVFKFQLAKGFYWTASEFVGEASRDERLLIGSQRVDDVVASTVFES